MPNVCEKCGWKLDGAQRFCPNCGAPVNTFPSEAVSQRFCAGCGSSLPAETKFCTICGTPCATTDTVAAVSAPATLPPANRESNSSVLKIVAIVLGLFAVITVLVIVSVVYVGYRAKKKADALEQAGQQNGLNQVLQLLGGKGTPHGRSDEPGTAKTKEGPAAPAPHFELIAPGAQSSPASKIPLCEGLRVVDSVNDPAGWGDYELIATVESVTPKGISLSFSSEARSGGSTSPGSTPTGRNVKLTNVRRTVLEQDRLHAHAIMNVHSDLFPESFPGTTALELSVDQLSELNSKGRTANTVSAITPDTVGALTVMAALMAPDPWSALPKTTCALTRVEPKDVAFPMIVNNQRTELPAIHARCTTDKGTVYDQYILDDADNPLGLGSSRPNGGMRTEITEITFPSKQPPRQIEQSLAQTGRVQVYGIHFNFASATLRPESEPVLQQIAQAMNDHSDWKISVEGHTDNIGGDAYNLDLSNQRAAAVTQALVERYHLSADRFTSVGYGASRPVASNDTLEGRALNRRVELARR